MADNETITPESSEEQSTLDQALDVDAGSGEGAASNPASLKDTLNEVLGKDFADDETALKSVKDTFAYIGKIGKLENLDATMKDLQSVFGTDQNGVIKIMKSHVEAQSTQGGGQETAPAVDPNKFVTQEQFAEQNYYTTEEGSPNKPFKPLIDAFKSKPEHQGKSIPDIVNSDQELQSLLENAKEHAEASESKSVLQSNPRLGTIKDNLEKSKVSKKAFETTGDVDSLKNAETEAVGAVLDSIENP